MRANFCKWATAFMLLLNTAAWVKGASGSVDASRASPANAPVDLAGSPAASPRSDPGSADSKAAPAADSASAPQTGDANTDIEKLPIRFGQTRDAGGAATQRAATSARSNTLDTTRVIASLGIVLGLIFVLKWIVSRSLGVTPAARPNSAIAVLSRTPLSPKQQLVLVRVGQRLVLIADSGTQASTLCEISDPDEVAQLAGQIRPVNGHAKPSPFGDLFGRFRKKFDGDTDRDEDAGDPWEDMPPSGDGINGASVDDNRAIAQARREVQGLMEKVRSVTRQFRNA